MTLKGQVAIITGGGRGMGYSIAERLASDGAAVVIADISADGACGAATRLREAGYRAQAIRTDITNLDSVTKMVQDTLNAFGRLDILVNNAGVGLNRPFLETTLEDWEQVLRVNLTGTFVCSQASALLMAETWRRRPLHIPSISC